MIAPTLTRPADPTITPAVLAWAAFAQIEETPERWEQEHYRTQMSGGWAFDFAGFVLNLDGAKWAAGERSFVHATDDDPDAHVGIVDGVPLVHARDRIRRLLGLDVHGMWLLVDLEDTDLEKLRTHLVDVFGELDEQAGRTA